MTRLCSRKDDPWDHDTHAILHKRFPWSKIRSLVDLSPQYIGIRGIKEQLWATEEKLA